MLAWGKKVSPQFRTKILEIASKIGCDPSWLMAYIAFETGGTFSPSVKNAQSGATGLIQFMPSTARGLGTTVEALAKMTAEDQLVLVDDYFKPYRGKIKTFSDGYMAILWPKAIGKPEEYDLFTEAAGAAYFQNKGLDLNKDGRITKAEAASFPLKRLDDGLQKENASDDKLIAHPTSVEKPMADTKSTLVDGIGAVASMLNPIAGIIFNAFSPLIKQKIATEVNRHTDTPGVGEAVADALNTAIIEKAKEVTGREDPLEAAAVTVQPQNSVKLEAVEQAASETLDERMKVFAPILEKTVELDRLKRATEVMALDAASVRYQGDIKAGGYDMTRLLIWFAGITSTVIIFGLLGVIVFQAVIGDQEIDNGLIGLAGPILAIAMGVWREIFAYRFDGNKDSSDQTKAVLNMSETAKNGR